MTELGILLTCANSGPAGEQELAKLPKAEYAIARSLGRMSRLRHVLQKPDVNEEKQAERLRDYRVERAKILAFLMMDKTPTEAEAILKELELDLPTTKEGGK